MDFRTGSLPGTVSGLGAKTVARAGNSHRPYLCLGTGGDCTYRREASDLKEAQSYGREQPHPVNSDEVEEGEVEEGEVHVGRDTAEEGMVEESEVVLNEQNEKFEGMQLAEDDAIVGEDVVTQFIVDPNDKTLVDTYKSELGRDETLATVALES